MNKDQIIHLLIRVFLGLVGCSLAQHAQAILTSGVHSQADYVNLAKTSQTFDATCYVHDSKHNVLQTGVLIAPDIVATAAHGVSHSVLADGYDETHPIEVKGVVVGFTNAWGQKITYKVQAVIIDWRYLENDVLSGRSKFDIAFLKLEQPVWGIEPAPLFIQEEIDNNSPLTVATYGFADLPRNSSPERRAFMFFDMDVFHTTNHDSFHASRSLLFSSVFFEPYEKAPQTDLLKGDERQIRSYKAYQNWLKHNKLPYALCLPGTSGSPVFVRKMIDGRPKDYLFGIITSFSPLGAFDFHTAHGKKESEYLLRANRKDVYGRYQSIFALFYKMDNDVYKADPYKRNFFQDPQVQDMITRLTNYRPKSAG